MRLANKNYYDDSRPAACNNNERHKCEMEGRKEARRNVNEQKDIGHAYDSMIRRFQA
jgi:hypothetical protein